MIYLDNSATTALLPEVREAMLPFLTEEYGNASSVYTLGTQARVALEEARETVARFLNAEPREITFTSSGTEANNTAIKGPIFKSFPEKRSRDLHVLTSKAEHHAVLHPIEFLEQLGIAATYLEVEENGIIDLDRLRNSITKKTAVVSLMMVNNEVGAINPITEIVQIVREKNPNTLIHTDAVQALGKLPINVRSLGIDLLSLSAHKIHGPKGIGALYTRSGVEWEPIMHGGAQERNRRGGTESVALAVGFAKAIELLTKNQSVWRERAVMLDRYLCDQLAQIPEVRLNSPNLPNRVPSILNFSFGEELLSAIDGEALLIQFDLRGIAVSNGSACTSGSMQPSHVLLAMHKGKEVASKSLRVSTSVTTTKDEIDQFITALKEVIAGFRR